MIDRYLSEHVFIEHIPVHPSMLNNRIVEHIRAMLRSKYVTTYKNLGYVTSLDDVTIVDSTISLTDQIIFTVKFKATMYVPKIGQSFRVKEIQRNSKHFWVNIGPLNVFIVSHDEKMPSRVEYIIKITRVKSDNTICFGELVD